MLYLEVLFWWAEANRPNSNVMFEGQSSQKIENRSKMRWVESKCCHPILKAQYHSVLICLPYVLLSITILFRRLIYTDLNFLSITSVFEILSSLKTHIWRYHFLEIEKDIFHRWLNIRPSITDRPLSNMRISYIFYNQCYLINIPV